MFFLFLWEFWGLHNVFWNLPLLSYLLNFMSFKKIIKMNLCNSKYSSMCSLPLEHHLLTRTAVLQNNEPSLSRSQELQVYSRLIVRLYAQLFIPTWELVYCGLAQVLCMLSQLLCFHFCSCPIVSTRLLLVAICFSRL